jgi:hypothetical protein
MTVRRVCLKPGGEAYVYYNIHTMHSGLQLNCNFIKTSQCLPRGSYHHMWRLSSVVATTRNGHVVTNTMSTQVTAPDGFSLHRAIYGYSEENHTNLTNNWRMNISLCFSPFYFLPVLYLHFCLFYYLFDILAYLSYVFLALSLLSFVLLWFWRPNDESILHVRNLWFTWKPSIPPSLQKAKSWVCLCSRTQVFICETVRVWQISQGPAFL